MTSFTVQFDTYSQDMLDILNDNKHLGGTLSCKADKSTNVFFTKRGSALTYLSTMNGLGLCGKLIAQEPKVATPTENIIAAPVAAHVTCTICERTVLQKDCWTVKDRGNTTYNCMNEKECKENKRIVKIKKIEKAIIDMPPVEELTELPDRYRDATVWYLHEKTMKVYGKSLFGEMKWKPASKEMQKILVDLWYRRQNVDGELESRDKNDQEQESKIPQDKIDDEQESKKPQDEIDDEQDKKLLSDLTTKLQSIDSDGFSFGGMNYMDLTSYDKQYKEINDEITKVIERQRIRRKNAAAAWQKAAEIKHGAYWKGPFDVLIPWEIPCVPADDRLNYTSYMQTGKDGEYYVTTTLMRGYAAPYSEDEYKTKYCVQDGDNWIFQKQYN